MAKAKQTNPDILAALNKIIRDCEETASECNKCANCNLDVTPEQQQNAEQLDTARKIKATFFPNAK